MKRLSVLVVALFAMTVFQGCLVAPVVPPVGSIYSQISAPLDYDNDATVVSTKSGEAEMVSYVGLVAMGDASTHAAAMDGGLKVVHYADYEYTNIIGIIQTYKTIVYGE